MRAACGSGGHSVGQPQPHLCLFRPSSNQVCDTLTEHLSPYHTAQAKRGEEGEREKKSEWNRTYDLVWHDADTPPLFMQGTIRGLRF